MGSVTVRKLDDDVKARLRVRAARHGRSLEEEVRQILTEAASEAEVRSDNLADAIRRIFQPLGGVDLDLPQRIFNRPPPRFEK
jgi:plasmid stability protein